MSLHRTIWTLLVFWLVLMQNVFAGISVQASIKPLQMIVTELTLGLADSALPLLPPGKTTHDFALRISDAQRVKRADILLWLGPATEPYLASMVSQKDPARVIDVSTLPKIQHLPMRFVGEEDSHHRSEHGAWDPHLWLSVDNAAVIAEALAAKLSRLDVAHANQYQQNLEHFKASLLPLAQFRGRFAQQSALYVVHHDAYQYLENYMGIKPLAVVTSEPEVSPGVRHLMNVAETIQTQHIGCFVAGPVLPPKIIPLLFKGRAQTSYQVIMLDPLAGDSTTRYSDFMAALFGKFSQCLSVRRAG